MRIRLTMPSAQAKKLKPQLTNLFAVVESDDMADEWECIAVIDPGNFKVINDLLQKESGAGNRASAGRIETLSFSATSDASSRGESIVI